MSPLIWLAVAAVAGAGAYYFGARALARYRARHTLDENEERYRAWRGRAAPPEARPVGGMTADERREIVVGAVLTVVAVAALLAFIGTSG